MRSIQHGLDLTRSIVAVGAGSTNSNAKRWPAERFVQTCQRLQKTLGAKIVLLGSEGDRAVSEQIMSGLGEKPLDLTGRTSIAEVSAILSVVDLLIANDMGLAHVARPRGHGTAGRYSGRLIRPRHGRCHSLPTSFVTRLNVRRVCFANALSITAV